LSAEAENHPAARSRAVELALCLGFAAFALVFCVWYFTSFCRITPAEELARSGWQPIVGGAFALIFGVVAQYLARRGQRTGGLLLAALAGALGLLLLVGLFFSGVRARVLLLLGTAVFFTLAVSLGAFLLSSVLKVRLSSAAEELALSGALGLGALALIYFLLGQVGLFRIWVLAPATLGLGALGARRLPRLAEGFCAEMLRTVRSGGVLGSALLALICGAYLLRLFYCFSPPMLGFMDYDALEYHLAAPLEWLESGWVSFLPHNAYANMPAAAELLYSPGLALAPDRWGGLHFSRLINLGCSELATLAVFAGARRLSGRRSALLAATIFFAGTWLADLTVNPYVEPVLLMATTAALLAFLAATGRGRLDLRRIALCGLLAGTACAAKYPALVLVAIPLVAVVFLTGLASRTSPAKVLVGTLLAGGLALAVVSPWYLRNWVAAGNPVYPLAASVFDSPYWDDEKEQRWQKAHRPGLGPAKAIGNAFWGRAGSRTNVLLHYENLRSGPLIIVFLPLAICGLLRRRKRGAIGLALLVGVYVAGWATLTHQIPRFLYPAYGGIALLAAVGAAELPRKWGRLLAPGLVLGATLVAAPGQFDYVRMHRGDPPAAVLSGREDAQSYLESLRYAGTSWEAINAVNRLPAGSKVLLVGEVRRALFDVPVIYCTVWDTHPLTAILSAPDADEAAARLREMGITHVCVNGAEFNRLRKSYGYLPLTPDQNEVRRRLFSRHLKSMGSWPGGWRLWKLDTTTTDTTVAPRK
jgi:hypothetical protein